MLTEWYPPCQAWPTAAMRASLLAGHLPEHGWRPIVLAPRFVGEACACAFCTGPAIDPDRASNITVHRLDTRRSTVRTVAARVRAFRHPATDSSATSHAPLEGTRTRLTSLYWLLGDTHSNWAPVVRAYAHRVVTRQPVDALWTTSAPFAHIRIGARLSRLQGLPWVADLQDPFSLDVTAPEGWPAHIVRARRATYRRPLLQADAITSATQQVGIVDGAALGREPTLIVPGFDDDQWSSARSSASPQSDHFDILYAGKLYEQYRRPDVFLRGLRLAADFLSTEDRSRLRFVYYGRSRAFLGGLVKRYRCEHLVVDGGFVDPSTTPSLMASATALLLLTNEAGASGVPGGKFFEYLAAHRPILATPGGDSYVSAVLSETGAGSVASDAQQVSDLIVRWFLRWRINRELAYEGDPNAIGTFSARRSAQALANLLDEAVTRQDRHHKGTLDQGYH